MRLTNARKQRWACADSCSTRNQWTRRGGTDVASVHVLSSPRQALDGRGRLRSGRGTERFILCPMDRLDRPELVSTNGCGEWTTAPTRFTGPYCAPESPRESGSFASNEP